MIKVWILNGQFQEPYWIAKCQSHNPSQRKLFYSFLETTVSLFASIDAIVVPIVDFRKKKFPVVLTNFTKCGSRRAPSPHYEVAPAEIPGSATDTLSVSGCKLQSLIQDVGLEWGKIFPNLKVSLSVACSFSVEFIIFFQFQIKRAHRQVMACSRKHPLCIYLATQQKIAGFDMSWGRTDTLVT